MISLNVRRTAYVQIHQGSRTYKEAKEQSRSAVKGAGAGIARKYVHAVKIDAQLCFYFVQEHFRKQA